MLGILCAFGKKGVQAQLHVETEAGKAFVHLRADIGQAEDFRDVGRRVGASRQRRRERSAAERQQADVAGKVVKAEADAETSAHLAADNPEEVISDPVIEIERVNATAEEAIVVNENDSGPNAEEAIGVLERDVQVENDSDLYTFTYWNNLDVSKAQEAVDYIEEKLKENFKKLKVKDIDQIYKIDKIESSEENEILVKMKLKKNNGLVERAARNVQTGYRSKNQHLVSIRSIQR